MFIYSVCNNNQREVFPAMPQLKFPGHVMNDLTRFISTMYSYNLPNSLLIAQEFILRYPNHGRKYGLSSINSAVEDLIKQGIFNY
jgi:hypothetical protein